MPRRPAAAGALLAAGALQHTLRKLQEESLTDTMVGLRRMKQGDLAHLRALAGLHVGCLSCRGLSELLAVTSIYSSASARRKPDAAPPRSRDAAAAGGVAIPPALKP